MPRAFLAHELIPVRDEDEMRSVLSDPSFDPARVPLQVAANEMPAVGPQVGLESVATRSMTSDRIVLRIRASSPAMLVLADAYYPGWKATVDGLPVKIYPAYWGLRGVAVTEGEREVVFRYRPSWLIPSGIISAIALICLLATLVIRPARVWRGDPKSPL